MKIEDRATPVPTRFVLLQHTLPPLANRPSHWDLMFDLGEKLLTFELRELPQPLALSTQPAQLAATRLADHRLAYLEFEGPLTPDPRTGAARGSVLRVAAGRVQTEPAGELADPKYLLTAPELSAQLRWPPCAVGKSMVIQVFQWEWVSS